MANDADGSGARTGAGGGTKKEPHSVLFRSFEESELPKTDHFYVYEVVDGITEKQACTLPIFDGTNRDVLLFLVSRLRDVADENDFGPNEHWKHFPKALRGSAKDQWKTLYNAIPENSDLTVELFNETLNGLIAVYFPAGSRNLVFQSMRALTQTTRPTGFSVTRLFSRLETMRLEAMLIPSAHDEELTDNELKNIAYGMLKPFEQVSLMRKYNNDIGQATFAQLMQDVRNETVVQSIYQESRRSKKRGRGNGNGNGNGNNDGRDRSNNNGNRNRNNQGGGRGGRRNKRAKQGNGNDEPAWGPDAKCRKHPQGNHLWKDCYENPRNQQGNGNQRYNSRNNNNQSYARQWRRWWRRWRRKSQPQCLRWTNSSRPLLHAAAAAARTRTNESGLCVLRYASSTVERLEYAPGRCVHPLVLRDVAGCQGMP